MYCTVADIDWHCDLAILAVAILWRVDHLMLSYTKQLCLFVDLTALTHQIINYRMISELVECLEESIVANTNY